MMRSRSLRLVVLLATVVVLLPGCDAADNAGADTTLVATSTTDAPATTNVSTTTSAPTTTAPPTPLPASQDDTTAALAPIGATWSYLSTVDDWLTEPMMLDGRYYATSNGLEDGTEQEVDGQVEGVIEDGGELWTSLDGVTWTPAEEGDRPPPAPSDAQAEGAAVVVRRNPIGDQYGQLVAEGLWATSDGASWREIPLRPSQHNWVPWVETGGLGWVVYSPPREATVEADASSLFSGPRHENLGLWYTPNTEAWFEVTDLGPLADTIGDTVDNDGEIIVVVNDGEVGVYGAAMIVRETDILAYVNIATSSGWVIGDPHTEIWRLELSPEEPVDAFDSATQSLCDWFTPEQISAIVTSTYEEFGVPLDTVGEMGQQGGQNGDCFWVGPLVTLSEQHESVDWAGTTRAQHPALDDSVLVSIREPGRYGLMTGLDALLRVDGHPEPLWFGHATPESVSGDVEIIASLGLTIANKMLQQMGWIAATGAIEAAGWSTVLADTQANVPPTAATCPSSATPNLPGASDQPRPVPGWVGNLAGAFDRHMGRIVYVDIARETWTFDVCTNTWHEMNANSGPAHTDPVGQLVYDVDSDVTIALGYGGVSVYNANTNTWRIKADPPEGIGPLGAVYDPISGLVITSTNEGGEDWDLWTYDVDTDTWTPLGTVPVDWDGPCCIQISLLGYVSDIDRLILTTYISSPTTILINPRTGETTFHTTSTGLVNLVWPSSVYGPGGDTVYVYPGSPGTLGISGFDSTTATWILNKNPEEVPSRYAAFGAVVGDPINNRLILINGVHGERWSDATDDVWAVDLAIGDWTQILSPATP